MLENKGFSMFGFVKIGGLAPACELGRSLGTHAKACATSDMKTQKQSHCEFRRMNGVT
jgi:hypothetical protein